MSAGEIVIKLELDDKNFKGSISGASGDVRRFERAVKSSSNAVDKAEHHSRSWARTLRDSVIVLGLARHAIENLSAVLFSFPTAVIRANAEIERMTYLMRGLSTEASTMASAQADANDSVNYLFDLAKKTPFSVNALTDSFVKFKAVGLDPMNGGFQALIDSVAKFGGTPDNMKRASIAIQQMAGKGVISMEELRQQLGESVPNAIQTMSRGLGIGMGELVTLISTGTVEAKSALDAMFRQMNVENYGAAEEMAKTWDGLMNRLNTRMAQAAKEIGDAGFFDEAKKQLEFLVTDFMERPEFSRAMYEIGQAMQTMIQGMAAGVGFIYENFTAIKILTGGLVALAVMKKTAAFREEALNAVKAKAIALNKVIIAQDAARAQMVKQNAAVIGGQMLMATNSFNQSMARSARISAQLQTDMSQLGNLARATGRGLQSLGGRLLGVFGGWAGLVATVAAGAATWYFTMREEHNKTYENLKNKPLRIMEPEQLKKFEEDTSRAEGLRKKIKLLSEEMETLPESMKKYRQAEIDDLQRQLTNVEKVIGDANQAKARLIEFKMQNEKNQLDSFLTVVKNDLKQATQQATNKYIETYQNDLDEDGSQSARDRNLKRREQYETKITDIIQKEIETRRENLQKAIDERINRQDKASRDEVTKLQKQMDALEELREEMLARFKESGGLELTNKGENEKELSALQQHLQSRQKMLAKYNSRSEGGNPYLAELEAMIEMERFSKATTDELDEARRVMEDLWKARQAWDAQNAQTKAFEGSLQRIDELSGQINNKFTQRTDDNPLMRDTLEADKLKAKLQEVSAEISSMTKVDEEARTGALRQLDQMARAVEAKARAATVNQIESATGAMNKKMLPSMERIKDEYREIINQAWEWRRAQSELSTEELEAFNSYLTAINKQMTEEMKSPMDELIEQWSDGADTMKDLWTNTMESFVDTLTNGLIEGKLELDDFVKEFGRMVIKMQLQKAAAGLAAGLGGMFGGGVQNVSSAAGANGYSTTGYAGAYGFADGGIMTPRGALALKTYANGGIANSPQVAVYGEGRQPEAYVPLPDGRTIPVTVSSEGSQGGAAGGPPVTVNVINQSGQPVEAESGQPKFDGRQFVLDVVLKSMNQPGNFRSGMKSALRK